MGTGEFGPSVSEIIVANAIEWLDEIAALVSSIELNTEAVCCPEGECCGYHRAMRPPPTAPRDFDYRMNDIWFNAQRFARHADCLDPRSDIAKLRSHFERNSHLIGRFETRALYPW